MAESQKIKDLIALIESFNSLHPRIRKQRYEEFFQLALKIVGGKGDTGLFSIFSDTDNELILTTFQQYDSGIRGEDIKETIAKNRNASPSILDSLRKNSYKIQYALLSNSATSNTTLEYLARYGQLSSIKVAAKHCLERRKNRSKSENEKIANGETSFHLRDTPFIMLPNELPESLMVELTSDSFVSANSAEYEREGTDYLARNDNELYLCRIHLSLPKPHIALLIKIEQVSPNKYKIVEILNKSIDIDEI